MNPYKQKAKLLDSVLEAQTPARRAKAIRKAHAGGVAVTVMAQALKVSRVTIYEWMEAK